MKKPILDALLSGRLYFDGATGSVLAERGLGQGEAPECMNERCPEVVEGLHREYLDAGADIIKSNTFGINPMKYPDYADRIARAMQIAARALCGREDKYLALDIGPLGRLISPLGDLPFEEAVAHFAAIARSGESYADLILIETVSDAAEAKAAVLGVREATDKPIFVSCVYDGRGKLMTGADPAAMIAMLEGLGVSAVGMNCSQGPCGMAALAPVFSRRSSLPIIVNPNAGLPEVRDGRTVYNVTPTEFAREMSEIAPYASVLGGCCGTTPEYIRAVRRATETIPYAPITKKSITTVSSYTHAVDFDTPPVLIGERLNPTGKSRLKAALREGRMDYILSEAIGQADAGAMLLDVNVGLPELDEADLMYKCVTQIQSVTDLPLCIDTADASALERAMRAYVGKPLVNSVNGKRESMEAVFPLLRRYGGAVIALTLDEGGIPDTAEERVAIAERIIAEAIRWGIPACDVIVDPLALSVSADPTAALTTLRTVRLLTERGIKTSLGVSNISFGLPERDKVSSTFFAEALSSGLSAAIMNPYSERMRDVALAHRALHGTDVGCAAYIAANSASEPPRVAEKSEITLTYAVRHGMKDISRTAAGALLSDMGALDIINTHIIPALDEVGAAFERGEAYLPELLACADAASAAFDEVRLALPKKEGEGKKVLLATVKGDVHDIGKNIVKVMLESYGFDCIDLGRDVSAEVILDAVHRTGARLVGLSALMTTTVPEMERTVALIHSEAEGVAVMVGGAVLNPEYAKMINADYYGADAMESVRIAESFYGVR